MPFIIRSVLCDPNLNPAGCRCSNRRNFILKKIITKAVCLLCAGALVLGAAFMGQYALRRRKEQQHDQPS